MSPGQNRDFSFSPPKPRIPRPLDEFETICRIGVWHTGHCKELLRAVVAMISSYFPPVLSSRLLKNCVGQAISVLACVIFECWRFFASFFRAAERPMWSFQRR